MNQRFIYLQETYFEGNISDDERVEFKKPFN